MSKNLTVTVSPDGTGIKVEVDNVPGPSCVSLTKSFEALGIVSHREKKTEYFLQEDQLPIETEAH